MRVGIDETWRIYACSEHLESLTVEQAAAELIHVINHVLRDHAQRARNTGVDAATAAVWNVAADCEINDDLYDDDLLDDTAVLPDTFDLEDCLTAERYHQHLLDDATIVEVRTQCGSAATASTSPTNSTTTPQHSPTSTKLCSNTPSPQPSHSTTNTTASTRCPKDSNAGPTRHCTPESTGDNNSPPRCEQPNTTRPAPPTTPGSARRRRQQAQDPVLRPALTRPTPAIAVVVDTSGSMSRDELDQALTEIKAIITTVTPGDPIRVLSVDTEVHTDQHIHNTNHITLTGAGGTNMATGITTAAQTNPDAIIVITDGWTPWPQTPPPGARTVIAALTNNHRINGVPHWIQTIDITQR